MNKFIKFKKAVVENNISELDLLFAEHSYLNVNVDFVLSLACMNGKLDILKHLKNKNININIFANADNCFNFACLYGHMNIIEYLIQEEFDFSLNPITYIQSCCQNSHLDVVIYLLDYSLTLGINISLNNFTPFFSENLEDHLKVYQLQKKLEKELSPSSSLSSVHKIKI